MVSEQARAVEALLFASESPLAVEEIARRLNANDVDVALAELTDAYAGRGINLVERGGRWHFQTAPDMAHLLRETPEASRKLSRAISMLAPWLATSSSGHIETYPSPSRSMIAVNFNLRPSMADHRLFCLIPIANANPDSSTS